MAKKDNCVVLHQQVLSPARVGIVAPNEVIVLPGNTMYMYRNPLCKDLNILAKHRNSIANIIAPVELIKKCNKVGIHEAALLDSLGILPFSFGLIVEFIYKNGMVFTPEVLDLTEDDLIKKFANGVSIVTSLALAVSYPMLEAAHHTLINAYKDLIAVGITTDYSFPVADKVKEFLRIILKAQQSVINLLNSDLLCEVLSRLESFAIPACKCSSKQRRDLINGDPSKFAASSVAKVEESEEESDDEFFLIILVASEL